MYNFLWVHEGSMTGSPLPADGSTCIHGVKVVKPFGQFFLFYCKGCPYNFVMHWPKALWTASFFYIYKFKWKVSTYPMELLADYRNILKYRNKSVCQKICHRTCKFVTSHSMTWKNTTKFDKVSVNCNVNTQRNTTGVLQLKGFLS